MNALVTKEELSEGILISGKNFVGIVEENTVDILKKEVSILRKEIRNLKDIIDNQNLRLATFIATKL